MWFCYGHSLRPLSSLQLYGSSYKSCSWIYTSCVFNHINNVRPFCCSSYRWELSSWILQFPGLLFVTRNGNTFELKFMIPHEITFNINCLTYLFGNTGKEWEERSHTQRHYNKSTHLNIINCTLFKLTLFLWF